ncbi:MAG: tRNA (guanine(26)-N(2))-dimethyltransferase [Methanobacteriaceae archaeon]|jgi:tRNA (guanine26-N2/guanine27-N2)-dimethyltransferase|nr:tRNA (guanine(26)-N(2))-dimethyltransferase [Methanobacteriaceae archaeon]
MDESFNYNKNDLKEVEEGLTIIKFPEFDKVSSTAPVFYNPKMEFNRDISILAIQTFQKKLDKNISICDLFGGSGIRGIRYKKEIQGVSDVAINDISSVANEFEKINIEINDVFDLEVYNKEANLMLREHPGEFDVVDIDPFGSPSFFIDSAANSIKKNSLLCVTATDTSALCGTYTEPCIRKYNSKPYKSEYCHETGIRILAGFLGLSLAKYKKYIDIKLSHSSEHYIRLYISIKKGSLESDESLKNIGYISHCRECLYRETNKGLAVAIPQECKICESKLTHAGPLWLGKIQDKDFIKEMIKTSEDKKLNTKDKVLKLLNTCLEESNAPATFYDVHVLCKNLKISAPKYDLILEKLLDKGYLAIKTHYTPLGIKTDAPITELKKIVKDLAIN